MVWLQIGQELEDVLAERDALKLVNQELAKRVTHPDSNGPCKRCMQVCLSASMQINEQALNQWQRNAIACSDCFLFMS